jgi:(p)ppGpp synthase/HD superfamily hydrolase
MNEMMLPYGDEDMAVVRLENGRVARVVRSHHASPRERWQMYTLLRAARADYMDEGNKMTRRKRWKLNRMFLRSVLAHDCKACWYEISDE